MGGVVRVFFSDGTKKSVEATPATTSKDLIDSLKKVIINRMNKKKERDVEVFCFFTPPSLSYFRL